MHCAMMELISRLPNDEVAMLSDKYRRGFVSCLDKAEAFYIILSLYVGHLTPLVQTVALAPIRSEIWQRSCACLRALAAVAKSWEELQLHISAFFF